MEKGDDPYEILGVAPEATESEIKKAYRQLALKCHPDRVAEDEREEANSKFARLSAAYETLTDPVKKYDWDLANKKGKKETPATSPTAASPPANPQASSSAPPPAAAPPSSGPTSSSANAQTSSTSRPARPRTRSTSPKASPKEPMASNSAHFRSTFHRSDQPRRSSSHGPLRRPNRTENTSYSFTPHETMSPRPRRAAAKGTSSRQHSPTPSHRSSSSYGFAAHKNRAPPPPFVDVGGSDKPDTSYSFAAPSKSPGRRRASMKADTTYSYSAPTKPKKQAPKPDGAYSFVAPPFGSEKVPTRKKSTSARRRSISPKMARKAAAARNTDTTYSFAKPASERFDRNVLKEKLGKKSDNPSAHVKPSSARLNTKKPNTAYSYAKPTSDRSPVRSPVPRKSTVGKKQVAPNETSSSRPGLLQFHNPFEIFDRVMREDFGANYKESDDSGWSDKKKKKKAKEKVKKKDKTKKSQDEPQSVSMTTKTIHHDDGRVEVKTITKVIHQDGSVEKTVQSSFAEKGEVNPKHLPKNSRASYVNPKTSSKGKK